MAIIDPAVSSMKSAADHYVKDLAILSDEDVLQSFGGAARKPVDFSFEVGLINLRIAARLRGEEPPPEPDGDWWQAPEKLRTKEAIIAYMTTTSQTLTDAASALSDEAAMKPVGAPGREQTPVALLHFAALHTMYHDAQLNFIQSLRGDLEMHWG